MKVAIVGPESTGKSVLAQCLAKSFGVAFIPEYSREYLSGLDRNYRIEDLDEMAEVQFDSIQKAKNAGILIADTEILTLKIWSVVKYGRCSETIEKLWNAQHFDLYLLCRADLPWEYDELREVPDEEERKHIFNLFKNELEAVSANYFVISGKGQARCDRAQEFVREFLEAS